MYDKNPCLTEFIRNNPAPSDFDKEEAMYIEREEINKTVKCFFGEIELMKRKNSRQMNKKKICTGAV